MSGHTVKEYYVAPHVASTVSDMFQVLEGVGPTPHTATCFQLPQETTKGLLYKHFKALAVQWFQQQTRKECLETHLFRTVHKK